MLKDYISIDLEMTGLAPKRDRIIEIGALKVRNGEIVDVYSTFVNPERSLSDKTIEITGITDENLSHAPTMEEVYEALFTFLSDDVLIGQKIQFDYAFLKRVAVNHGIPFEKKGIDTLKIARKYLAHLESRTLSSLCRHYQIDLKAHRALEDARATHFLYQKMAEEFEGEEKDSVFQLQDLTYQIKKESPATSSQKEQMRKLAKRYQITIEENMDSLTKNEASRIIDHILAKYGRL